MEKILSYFGLTEADKLGEGGEGKVYSLNEGQVIKIFKKTDPEYVKSIQELLTKLSNYDLGYETPVIFELGQREGLTYCIEKKLSGEDFLDAFCQANEEDKNSLLVNYWNAARKIGEIEWDDESFGQVVYSSEQIKTSSWSDYLIDKIEQRLLQAGSEANSDVKELDKKYSVLKQLIKEFYTPEKRLVHADFCPGNVLVNEKLEVSAVLDFGVHTSVGDRMMDLAGSIIFLSLHEEIGENHVEGLKEYAKSMVGDDLLKAIDFYLIYYSFYYLHTKHTDPNTYAWAVNNLALA